MVEKPRKHVFLCGSDEFGIQHRARDLVQESAPEDEMNLEVLDGSADTVDSACDKIQEIRGAILTLPFFGGRKLVHIKNATFFQDSVVGRSDRIKEALAKLAELLEEISPEEVQCIFSASGADKRKAFFKKFGTFGQVEAMDLPDIRTARGTREWAREIGGWLEEADFRYEQGVPEMMVEAIGNNTRIMRTELDKIFCYVHPEKEIRLEDLAAVMTRNRELLVWDLCDAVTCGRTEEAIPLLRQLLAQGESEVGLMILLSGQIRLAALLVWLQENGHLNVASKGRFKEVQIDSFGEELLPTNKSGSKPSGFRMLRIVEQAGARPSSSWFEAVETCFTSHLALLSGTGNRIRNLESTIVRLCQG